MCQLPSYRQALLSVLPQITQLDNISSEDAMAQTFDVYAAQAAAALQLQAYEGHATNSAAAQGRTTPAVDAVMSGVRMRLQQQQGGAQMEGYDTQYRQYNMSGSPYSGQLQHVQHASSSSPSQRQYQHSQPTSTPQGAVHSMPQHAAQRQEQLARQAGGTLMQQPGSSPGQWQGREMSQQVNGRDDRMPDQSALARGGVGSALVRKVYLVDAAVQTADNSDKALRALRLQNEQLANQLTAVTGRLRAWEARATRSLAACTALNAL